MDAKLTPASRLDALDAERFGEMIESEPFRRFLGRIRGDWERAQACCAREDNLIPLRRAQGAAAALEAVLRLPAAMHAEIKAHQKTGSSRTTQHGHGR